jgi:hypothetical protein
MKLFLLALALCVALSPSANASPAAVTLRIKNDIPKFERFYRDASKPGVTEEQRWKLWQREYGIAAVPPTPQGEKLARAQLDAAWPRYGALVPRLPELTAQAAADARSAAQRIGGLLDPSARPVTIALVLYVGQFDDNAFSIPAMSGQPPTSLMPVEAIGVRLLLAHELSHDVNFALAHVRNSFGAPLGETVFLEGLAMRSASRVFPGLPDSAYTEMTGDRGWLARCYAKRDAVLHGMLPYLDASGASVATRFTFGNGTTGMHREAYCAGWILVGSLLAHGHTLAQLATIPESAMTGVVRNAIKAQSPPV